MTHNVQREITKKKTINAKVMFLAMLIIMKFGENILNSLQVREGT